MAYSVKVVSRIEREDRIRLAQKASTVADEREFFDFRNEKRRLKFVRLDISLPIYRIENCRTYTEQEEYSARNGKPAGYFQSGQETESVQQIQHNILSVMAVRQTDSVASITEVLKKDGQREELLITVGGIVVNGNRRLAAMRELFASAPGDYAWFSHVNCIVLPEDATSDEILDVEASLQAKQETKLDYDWIGECRLISKLLESSGDLESVARKLHRKEPEIKNSLSAFAEAQLYLSEWIGKPRDFSLVKEDGEQFFNDLPRGLGGKTGSTIEASRMIGWVLFENRQKLPGRLYNYNIAVGKRAEDVLGRVSRELDVKQAQKDGDPASAGYDVSFEPLASESTHDNLVSALKDRTRREEIAETVIEVCQGVVESERDRSSAMNAQKAVIVASTRLMEIELSTAAPSSYPVIARHLEMITNKSAELTIQLAKFQAHQVAKAVPATE